MLPFCTADCERVFSAMNRIKSPERNKFKPILKGLMRLHGSRSREGEIGHREAFKGDKHRFVGEGWEEELF